MNMPTTEKLAYKVEEAASQLSLSRAKTYELIARGTLPSVLIDGSRRVPRTALQAFVKKLQRDQAR